MLQEAGQQLSYSHWYSGRPDDYQGKQHWIVGNYKNSGEWDDDYNSPHPFMIEYNRMFETS